MSEFYTLVVKKIQKETPNAVSIHFEVPETLKSKYTFKAGQYLTLETVLNDKRVRRAYSLCTTPHSGEHAVVIKEVENGAFSVFANRVLKEGGTLAAMPPEGRFTFKPDPGKPNNYAAFAAGSGITPIMSIVKTVLEKEPKSTFLLVYGNKNPEETIFLKQLMELQDQYPERFFLELVFSREESEGAQFGRISKSLVNYFLNTKYSKASFGPFYLCGPEPMIEEVRSALREKGVPADIIFYELFTTAEEEGAPQDVPEGETSLTVTLDEETTTFLMPQSKSVLDAVLEQDLDAPYSCQGGICSTCIARVVEGKATMRKNQILTDDEIAEGLILTCQAHPTTPVFSVDYDDV